MNCIFIISLIAFWKSRNTSVYSRTLMNFELFIKLIFWSYQGHALIYPPGSGGSRRADGNRPLLFQGQGLYWALQCFLTLSGLVSILFVKSENMNLRKQEENKNIVVQFIDWHERIDTPRWVANDSLLCQTFFVGVSAPPIQNCSVLTKIRPRGRKRRK